MNLPEYPAVMSGGCAIKARLEADFSRFFSPLAPERNPDHAPSSGASTSSEDSTP